ncbi:MAG: polysulfide reductase NrfD [Chloroflexi bacterium]|nr:polysulfide reductase NrfD [Chloroflexota bacterium]
MAEHSNGRSPAGMWVFPQADQITAQVMERTTRRCKPHTIALVVAALLAALGVVGFLFRVAADGLDNYNAWGYYMAAFSFVFMVTSGAPLATAAFRFTKSHWRRPLSRVAELFAVVGVLNLLLFIPMVIVLPAIENPTFVPGMEGEMAARRAIWLGSSGVPFGAPALWDILGLVALAVTSMAILWLSLMPDLAQSRDRVSGFRRTIYGLLAGSWHGTKRQWIQHKAGMMLLGGFYFMMVVFVHFLIVSDFAMSLIPGWKDSILPPLYTLIAFQNALGLLLVILFILRKWGGYQEYIGISLFWSASKILLGLTLLWTYHLFAFFITFWYGRLEVEESILRYLMFESYAPVFWANVIFSFFVPFFILLWNPVRKTAWGPALAGLSALVGGFLFSIRIFVGSFNAVDFKEFPGELYSLGLTRARIQDAVIPDLWDIFMVVGIIGAAALVYLAAAKLFPVMSIWEVKEGAMYQRMGKLFRGEYMILAKPE